MRRILTPLLPIFFLSGFLPAQFRMDVPVQTLPSNLNGELDARPSLSLFDPARFDINHGFTMQMMNMGGIQFPWQGLPIKSRTWPWTI